MFLHIDIDSFFASAERTVDSSLKGIPMAVGSRSNLEIFNRKRTNIRLMNDNSGAFVTPVFYSDREKTFDSYFVDRVEGKEKIRGIITTASYEARAYGVKTAMPIAQALQLCPQMVVVPSNYPRYHRFSHQIHAFMMKEMPKVEQFSIDEFFADVSGWIEDENVYAFAQELKAKMIERFDIPVSIGISKAKWIAKLATESAKPFGVYEVKDIDAYIEDMPIKAFPGIGRGFQKRLEDRYIKTLGDVKRNKSLFYSWKKPGIQLYHRVTGTCNEGIESRGERKSIGISRTFDPLYDPHEVKRRIMIMARHITYMVMAIEVNPTTFYLKVNYEYGIRAKKSETVNRLFSEQLFKSELSTMFEEVMLPGKGAVKLTLNVSNFTMHHARTLSLLDLNDDISAHALTCHIHSLREQFGLDIVKTADEL
ncbi:Y-family DNA polymerase [Sulfurovum sp. NBC37-1]|uniref:Y-family DNA polymerase n=1 Tax=Sulfurovum sp. (strain NBC37-1) TaxID=387093 RepID=UPI0001587D91|nr:DNA polymerase IV [Sulfurovum sp. NBC37-1]BAF72331.1 DNA polymerase IV [Sulfurovum sp. NBC37-1]